jgi:hypothetical protein
MNHAVLECKSQAAELQHHSPCICRDNALKILRTSPLYRPVSENHPNRRHAHTSCQFNITRYMLQFTQHGRLDLSFFISTWTFQDGFSPFKKNTTNLLPTLKWIKSVPTVHAYRLKLYMIIIVGHPEENRKYIQWGNAVFNVKCGGTYRSHWAEKCWCQEIQNDSNSKWLSSYLQHWYKKYIHKRTKHLLL